MSAMAAEVWAPSEVGHSSRMPNSLPKELELLAAHLTDRGRQLLADELEQAIQGPEPIIATNRVLSSWWLTLVARHQPGYRKSIRRPSPSRAEARYQSSAELKAELGF